MYLLIWTDRIDNRAHYVGPFPSHKRADEYALSIPSDHLLRSDIVPLTIPFAMIVQVKPNNTGDAWIQQ